MKQPYKLLALGRFVGKKATLSLTFLQNPEIRAHDFT